MEFRRSGQSNQRRRRVLKDDPSAAAGEGSGEGPARKSRGGSPLRQYSDHALAEHQLRVTDLIPQRAWTYSVLLLGGLFLIVATQTLFLHHSLAESLFGKNNLTAFDPTRTGSIAGWISSMLLGLSAAFGTIVFSLRRHKIDDYRGRYRVWLPLIGLFLATSLDASTGLHRAGRGLLEIVARKYGQGASLGSYPHFWWVAICLFGATVVGVRLAIEMRQSRAAVLKLVLALGCYGALACVEWNMVAAGLGEVTIVAASGARLLGDLCLCLSTATFARYVYLDAQGIIAARRLAREKKRAAARAEKLARREAKAAAKVAAAEEARLAKEAKAAAKAAAKSGTAAKSDEDEDEAESKSAAPQKVAAQDKSAQDKAASEKTAGKASDGGEQRSTAPAAKAGPLAGRGTLPQPAPQAASQDDEDDGDEDDGDGDSNLSRAERRRLKKMQRREMRKAA